MMDNLIFYIGIAAGIIAVMIVAIFVMIIWLLLIGKDDDDE